MILQDSSHAADDRCHECGAAHRPVSSGNSSSSKPPSYTVCAHSHGCSERKPTWGDYLQRSLS
jgi:hypothetical protein